MRNVKLLWGIIGCLLLLIAILGWDYAGFIGSRKVASVGKTILTEADWTEELKNKYGKPVLNTMIDRAVVAYHAEKNGISVSDDEIEKEMNTLQGNFPSHKELLLDGMNEGRAKKELKEEVRHYLLLEKLATMDVHISEEEMFRFYEQNKAKYKQPTLVRLSVIYIGTEAEAKQTFSELNNGADFETLAKERSTDIYSAASGGDLGWVSLQTGGELDQELVDKSMSMKEGQISTPVVLQEGYAVIKLVKRKEAKEWSFIEVKDEIRRELALSQIGSLNHILEQLRKNADIKFYQHN